MRSEDADLVAHLHRSARQNPPMAGFLQRLIQRLGAQAAFAIAESVTVLRSDAGQIDWRLADEVMQRMRYGRIYGPDDVGGTPPFRAVRMRMQGGRDTWLIIARQGVDFGATASAMMTLLAENFAVAAQAWVDLHRDQMVAAQMSDTLVRLGLAWVLVDGKAGAPVALASAGPLAETVLHQGRLRLPAPVLRALIAALQKEDFPPIAMQEGGVQLLALPAPQGAVIYLQQGGKQPRARVDTLAQFTGLTPAEARFLAQMVTGLTISQAGDALGITPQSARFYSKQVYAKLGQPHQTALLRMIDTSVLRMI